MAEDYIIGKNINRGDEARLKQGLILSDQGKVSKEEYHHEEIMDQMIKAIEFTKMDKKMRAVLLLRVIHGYSFQKMQAYLFFHGHFMNNSREELESIEREGKRLVHETLQRYSMQEIVSTINANSGKMTDLQNKLTTPKLDLGLS